jgi:putative hemolysin
MKEFLVLALLLVINAFFALSELALVSAKRSRLEAMAKRGNLRARVAISLQQDTTLLLSACQAGITLTAILTGLYSGAAFADDLAIHFAKTPAIAPYAEQLAAGLVVLPVSYLSLVLGELVPKRIALSNAERLAILTAPFMAGFARMAAPLVWLLRKSTDLVLRILPGNAAPNDSVTDDELRALLAEGARQGVFHAAEQRLVEGVLAVADSSVESIMVPRPDVIWLDLDEPIEKLWQEARASGHARFLVARGSLDEPVGVITLADLGEAARRGGVDETKDIAQPLMVPETVSVLRLLDAFQRAPVHLAVVTDEYGDVRGIVTPVDILRAIAGGMPDIGSRERAEMVARDDGSWLVDGHLPARELAAALDMPELAGDDYHTTAGFVLHRLGRIPRAGDRLTWRNIEVEVVDMDGPRIDKLIIKRRN